MIKIEIKRNQGDIIHFSAEGHAEYAAEGQDIICAAVSAILQTAAFGLINYLELKPKISTQNGWLSCELNPKTAHDEQVQAILGAMLAGLRETIKEYPDYLEIIEGGGNDA